MYIISHIFKKKKHPLQRHTSTHTHTQYSAVLFCSTTQSKMSGKTEKETGSLVFEFNKRKKKTSKLNKYIYIKIV